MGHVRSAYVFEIIRNYLKYSGYKVIMVRNVTDVDDKIIQKAYEANPMNLIEETKNISSKYFDLYKDELSTFNLECPDREPFATQNIEEMIQLIKTLIKKCFAYAVGGDVYFEVNKFLDYGKLSKQKIDQMLEGVRKDTNENKKNPLDFALWKNAKEGEPSWPSPWGMGRPGWHIECSAMSIKYLGETFDIHGGGLDLKFPHHENEIAQSEAATGKPFAKYWIHHGMITRDGHKMSKSFHNYIMYRELPLDRNNRAEQFKFLLLGTHYAAPLDYTEERLKMEVQNWRRFKNFFDFVKQIDGDISPAVDSNIKKFKQAFTDAMDDDFNTPLALTVMHEMLHYANKSKDPAIMLEIAKLLKDLSRQIFGLFLDKQEELVDISTAVEKECQKIRAEEAIRNRKTAKEAKDYQTADLIRKKLLDEYQIELIDLKGGKTIWREKL